MAAASAELAARGNSYVGNVNLGGGTFGAVNLDTKPIEDLAKYTMLYSRSLFDQRQKDAEAAAKEIADYTSYDLTSGIPKDAKLLQEKYEALTNFVRDNPTALDYRNKEMWAKYKKMRNDLDNDLVGAKQRNTLWALRQKEVQEQPNQQLKDILQKELDAEIEASDIRTPLKYSNQYQDNTVKLPDAPELTFDVTKVGPNAVVERQYSVFNVNKARANGDMFALGLDKNIDPNSAQGQRDALSNKNNFWLQGAEAFNSALNTKDANGNFINKKIKDSTTGELEVDESKLNKLSRNVLNLVKETNQYLRETKADIKAGLLLDKFEKPITFGPGALDENDYAEINYKDGITPEELALVAQYAKWKGDTYNTKVTQTDNALQASAQQVQMRGQDIAAATARRGQDKEDARFWAGFNKSNKEDLLSADAVLKEVSDAVTSGVKTDVVKYGADGKRTVVNQVVKIADPNLLKEFGTIDKDGNTTNVPDFVYLDPKTNKMSLVYQKRVLDAAGKPTAAVQMNNGEPVVDNQIELLPTQWMSNITKRKFPNQDIGGINTLINQVYDTYGRDIIQLVNGYTGGATISTNKTTTDNGKVSASGTKKVYKGLDPQGNPIFE